MVGREKIVPTLLGQIVVAFEEVHCAVLGVPGLTGNQTKTHETLLLSLPFGLGFLLPGVDL